MKNGTENLKNFIAYIEAYHGIGLTECSCINSGYKVFVTKEVMFHNDFVEELKDLHDDAWMAALDTQEL
tara:strand:- start:515 stop:721 length:207 start_codon:yes stop_codon:yes gene_type:complete